MSKRIQMANGIWLQISKDTLAGIGRIGYCIGFSSTGTFFFIENLVRLEVNGFISCAVVSIPTVYLIQRIKN